VLDFAQGCSQLRGNFDELVQLWQFETDFVIEPLGLVEERGTLFRHVRDVGFLLVGALQTVLETVYYFLLCSCSDEIVPLLGLGLERDNLVGVECI